MKQKIARWLREIKIEPPTDVSERPHVVQHLFKVSPPIEFTLYEAFRNGRVVRDPKRGLHHRHKVMTEWMRKAREAGEKWPFDKFIEKPRYFYANVIHKTSFVVASASDLRTYMNAANARMRANGEAQLAYYKGLEASDPTKAEGIARAHETIRLFSRMDREFDVETFLFPADKFGKIKNFGELEGSQRGTLDHRVPLQDAGYTVIGMPRELNLVPLILRAAPFEVDTGSGFVPATTTTKEEK